MSENKVLAVVILREREGAEQLAESGGDTCLFQFLQFLDGRSIEIESKSDHLREAKVRILPFFLCIKVFLVPFLTCFYDVCKLAITDDILF